MQNLPDSEILTIESQKRLVMTSVDTVDGFTSEQLKLTVAGKRVLIFGNDIKITSFNKATGNLTAEGLFNKISYEGKKTSILKKVFK